jgi:hypothetical protein
MSGSLPFTEKNAEIRISSHFCEKFILSLAFQEDLDISNQYCSFVAKKCVVQVKQSVFEKGF